MKVPIVPIHVPIADQKGQLTLEWQGFFSNLTAFLQNNVTSVSSPNKAYPKGK